MYLTPKAVSALHVVVVAPLLFLLSNDQLPKEYMQYARYVAVILAVFHMYKLCMYMQMDTDGVEDVVYDQVMHKMQKTGDFIQNVYDRGEDVVSQTVDYVGDRIPRVRIERR